MMAQSLEEKGSSEAQAIVADNKAFDGFKMKKFKEGLENKGIDYVLEKIPGLNKIHQKDLRECYKVYEETYNNHITSYSVNPSQETISGLISEIKNLGE